MVVLVVLDLSLVCFVQYIQARKAKREDQQMQQQTGAPTMIQYSGV